MMKKRFITAILWVATVTSTAFAQPVQNQLYIPEYNAASWILMDYETGAVLAEKNMHQKLEPASITKVMTSYIIAEEIEKNTIQSDALVTISNNAYRQGGSRMYLEENSKVSVENLVKGLVIQSGNDAAMALAEYVAGSSDAFAFRMNQKARELGMQNTHFMNPSGLPDPNHFSTAYDLAVLSRELIKNYPSHYGIYAEKSFTWNVDTRTGRPITQPNRNNLLREDPSVDGIKTGHTDSAGYCLASSAERNNHRFIAVVLGTQSVHDRDRISQNILNFGFQNFSKQHLFDAGEPLQTINVRKGTAQSVAVGTAGKIEATLPLLDYDNVKSQIRIKNNVVAPIEKGSELGSLEIHLDDQLIYSAPLVALESVEEAGFVKQIWDDFKFKLHNKYMKFKAAL